jgi:hypothetical protein
MRLSIACAVLCVVVVAVCVLVAAVVFLPALSYSFAIRAEMERQEDASAGAWSEALRTATTLPTEFERQMWVMAVNLVVAGYRDDGQALNVTTQEINAATTGDRTLSPPDNAFHIEWKLVRKSNVDGASGAEIPPSCLSCSSQHGLSQLMHDRIQTEWLWASWLLRESEWDAANRLLITAAALHEKRTDEPETFAEYVSQQRESTRDIAIDHVISGDPPMSLLTLKHESNGCRFEYNVTESSCGSTLVLTVKCLNPSYPAPHQVAILGAPCRASSQ